MALKTENEKIWGSPADEEGIGEDEARELMCEIGRRLWQRDMADCNAGNLSMRLGEGRFLCTPTLIAKGFMRPRDLIVIDAEGHRLEGDRDPTSEMKLHLTAYACRPDVKAVLHAHPRHVAAFAATETNLPSRVLTEVELTIGEVAMTPYGTPGTQEFADGVRPYLEKHTALILARHGALTQARGLIEAYWHMETLESYCAVVLAARGLGEFCRIGDDSMRQILATKRRLGVPDPRIESEEFGKIEI